MRTVENVLNEITNLNGQDNSAAFEKFLEVARIGIESGDKSVHIMGLLNAAGLACKMGNYDLCMKITSKAQAVDEEIWTTYLWEPHMQEMLKELSKSGVFN
jgi:hypothetical protein